VGSAASHYLFRISLWDGCVIFQHFSTLSISFTKRQLLGAMNNHVKGIQGIMEASVLNWPNKSSRVPGTWIIAKSGLTPLPK
jgi:hypothetical protein